MIRREWMTNPWWERLFLGKPYWNYEVLRGVRSWEEERRERLCSRCEHKAILASYADKPDMRYSKVCLASPIPESEWEHGQRHNHCRDVNQDGTCCLFRLRDEFRKRQVLVDEEKYISMRDALDWYRKREIKKRPAMDLI